MTLRRSSVLAARFFGRALAAGSVLLSVCVALCASYLSFLTVAGSMAARRSPRRTPDPDPATRARFAIFVPAHDEAAVIERTIRAMTALDYPRDRFSVHVVADNCSDDTAALARRAGATVHERTDVDQPGKGPALNWLFERVAASHDFDAVVIVDADTVIDASFLAEMNVALAAGSVAAQGHYDVIDLPDSAATGVRAAALASRHHLRPLGRTAAGGSCGLFGNGMVFERSILAERRWSGHLVEDAELQNELLLDGIRVDYVPGAEVRAEMPDSFDGSTTQNERWELGRLQVARRYVPQLVRLAATGEPRLRVARLDAAVDHCVPPMSVLVAANGLAGLGSATSWLLLGGATNRRSAVLSMVSAGAIVGHILVALKVSGAPRSTYRALAAAPKAIMWKVGLWVRVLVRPESVAWVRTRRNGPEPS